MSADEARVRLAAGELRGLRERGVEVYRGVPFATAHRFRAPEPVASWSGVRDATRFGPAPPQRPDPLVHMLRLAADDLPTSEDCLTLNVWTPRADDAGRPVLVWIHGGAFLSGSGAAPLYDGARLAARGDAVVVTLNYRVGALGFLGLPGLPANLGLLDQLRALEFVRAHAARFGGDPQNVTVLGESAGAGSICALLAMPAAQGLFTRAIVQSGAPEGMLDRDEAERRGRGLLGHLGLADHDLDGLRQLPVERVLDAQQALLADGPYANGMLFSPVVDGDSLPGLPVERVAAGAARDVALVIGTNREELQLYQLGAPPDAIGEAQLRKLVAPLAAGAALDAGGVIDVYRSARPDATPAQLYYAVFTDVAMRVPSIRLAEAQARQRPDTWMYLFTWPSPMQGGALGACHALDLPFTFGALDQPGMAEFAGKGPEAEGVAANWMDAWLAFARAGDPAHPGIGAWPRYERERRATMLFGERCAVADAPLERQRALWDAIGEGGT